MSENEQEYGLKLMRQYCDDLKFVGNLKDVDLLPTNAKVSTISCTFYYYFEIPQLVHIQEYFHYPLST